MWVVDNTEGVCVCMCLFSFVYVCASVWRLFFLLVHKYATWGGGRKRYKEEQLDKEICEPVSMI